ncbi:MAG: DUF72 domain-containing protein [Elusimicrobiota bacterium]|jgi:uncharacterized protein YecE (DUF72 family)
MELQVGCCGFPVAQASYFRRFSTVELSEPFYNLPRLETAKLWKARAPEGFEFSLRASQLITHPVSSPTYMRRRGAALKNPGRYGHFLDTDEVRAAWARVLDIGKALSARFIVFQTPGTFHPSADHLRDIYRFFKKAERTVSSFVWEPRGGWEDRVVDKICADLHLLRVQSPWQAARNKRGPAYMRFYGRMDGKRVDRDHTFTDDELKGLLRDCPERAYVYFCNRAMWQDADRFRTLAMGTR